MPRQVNGAAVCLHCELRLIDQLQRVDPVFRLIYTKYLYCYGLIYLTPHSMSPIDSIPTVQVQGATYYMPRTTDELSSLISDAVSNGKKISMRGSGHSFPMIPYLEARKNCMYIMMSYFNTVSFDDSKMEVTVGGGCHLGLDPYDPTPDPAVRSTLENSLFYKIYMHGWAIPEMGGITHQTVGGFLSTGSSGGSLIYSFDEMLVSITLMTAEPTPTLRTFSIGDANTDNFYAAGIALGMFGVIVSATFTCVENFNIQGTEAVSTVADCLKNCNVDLFGSGPQSLQNFFQHTEYTRLIWWPQEKVQKIVVWQARQIQLEKGFTPKPYREVPHVLGSGVPAELLADAMYSGISEWPGWFEHIFGNSKIVKSASSFISKEFYPHILPLLLHFFVTPDKKGPQQFHDYWWSGLCMDNQMSDKLMPVMFTELWIPVNQTQEVMNALLSFYGDQGQNHENTGFFCIEIYGAKASDFWMSPSYKTDVIRLDVFWFANSDKDPVTTLFQRYWDTFARFNFRCHWGKYLPKTVNGQSGSAYISSQYPNWSKWTALRSSFDPRNVFVNPYWTSQLGL